MSQRLRGQEAQINITVSDAFAATFNVAGLLGGSFFKVNDWVTTPRIEQSEEGFLGEDFDDLDQQVNGYDYSFTVDELDAAALDLLSLIVFKEANKLPRPNISVSATYLYRDGVTLPRTEQYIDGVLKMSERSVGGRKEYIKNSFEGKAKTRVVLVG